MTTSTGAVDDVVRMSQHARGEAAAAAGIQMSGVRSSGHEFVMTQEEGEIN